MDRKIEVFFLSFVLVAMSIRSADTLECYVCASRSDKECNVDLKSMKAKTCNPETLQEFQNELHNDKELKYVSTHFRIDKPKEDRNVARETYSACTKMQLKINNTEFTIRGCDAAKAETVDFCKSMTAKLSNDHTNVKYCGLCESNACNSGFRSAIPWCTNFFVVSVMMLFIPSVIMFKGA